MNSSPTREQSPEANPTLTLEVASPQKEHVYIADQQSDVK